jgi:hypothetical protein
MYIVKIMIMSTESGSISVYFLQQLAFVLLEVVLMKYVISV